MARQKPRQIRDKKSSDPNFSPIFFFDVEKRNVQNRPKPVLAKFRADPSHVRRVYNPGSDNPGSADDQSEYIVCNMPGLQPVNLLLETSVKRHEV